MRWGDLDSLNHVNNVAYVDYAAEGRAAMVDAGLLADEWGARRMTVKFVRPLQLTRRPVTVASTLDGDVLTQLICVGKGDDRVVYSEVVSDAGSGVGGLTARADVAGLPLRARRRDVGASGVVDASTTFELFQEGRILFVSSAIESLPSGTFVVGTTTVDFVEPITWRVAPYEVRSHVSTVGTASFGLMADLVDGDTVLARAETVLVGFDVDAQSSRRFSDEERAELLSRVVT